MADNRRQALLLVVLAVVLAGVLAWQFWPSAAEPGGRTPAARAARGPADPAGDIPPPHVRVAQLDRVGPERAETGRDPFRFEAARRGSVAPPPVEAPPPATQAPPEPVEPAGPPPPPPITLKFIGLLTASGAGGRFAVLSDGRFVYYGREGDIIEGRYRLVKIGEESLQIEYLDGRGRQTLRLSGA